MISFFLIQIFLNSAEFPKFFVKMNSIIFQIKLKVQAKFSIV
jgi:hypothetical protein